MENYLFLGGAGFIGSSIIRRMPKEMGSPNITVLEPEHGDISRLKECNVRVVRGTLKDTDTIEQIIARHHVTTVVHLVSTMTPVSSYEDYVDELHEVVIPTIEIMGICSRLGVKLVFFSSGGAIYGESQDCRPFKESTPLHPISYYGLSKLIIETNIRFEHRTNGLQYLILRPSNPFGPGQDIHGRHGIVAVAIGKILAGQPITVWGDGSARRDYIYIDDMADAACAIMRSCAVNEAVNIGSGTGLSVKDIIGYINDVVSEPVHVQYGKSRKGDVTSAVLDTTRMQQICPIRLTNIREGIRAFYTASK